MTGKASEQQTAIINATMPSGLIKQFPQNAFQVWPWLLWFCAVGAGHRMIFKK